jgi:DHA1 family bicyclomycin/chloramphenicol resistance-like MFS transporter
MRFGIHIADATARARTRLLILAALSMMGALSIDAYLPALPAIAEAMRVPLAAAQQTLTIYLFGFAAMMLFYGMLSDSFGRRPVILFSLACYLASSIGAAAATSLGWLLFWRLLQGLSAGAGPVVGRAMVTDLLKGPEAQRELAFIGMIFGVAPAVAPVIGGWLQAAFGWQSIFIFIALFTLVLLVVCLLLLPESLPREERHAFHFKLIVANYWEVGSHARFIIRALAYALSFSGIMIYVGAAPAFVINILHLSVKEFAWLFVPLIGGMTLGSYISGRLSHLYSQRTLIVTGYLVMAASAFWNFAYTWFFVATIPWAVIPLFFYGIGSSITMPVMMLIGLEMFPRVRGMASSFQSFVFMIVFAIGSGVVCPLLFGSAFHLAAGVAVGLALSLVCWLLGRIPTKADP